MLLSSKFQSATLKVGARDSLLSQAQVKEVFSLLHNHHPKISSQSIWMKTPGDRDQTSSLRNLEKTDFFTRDLDLALKKDLIRISIHSAKDLPEPLDPDLQIIAITEGLDPRDMVVPSSLYSNKELPFRPIIGTSSERREQAVKKLYKNAICKEIRGSILQRIDQLDNGEFDAIIVPECAIIRLGMTKRSRIELGSPSAPLQGQLAVLAKNDDNEMKQLFSCIDAR